MRPGVLLHIQGTDSRTDAVHAEPLANHVERVERYRDRRGFHAFRFVAPGPCEAIDIAKLDLPAGACRTADDEEQLLQVTLEQFVLDEGLLVPAIRHRNRSASRHPTLQVDDRTIVR